jgi:hypothetical protein
MKAKTTVLTYKGDSKKLKKKKKSTKSIKQVKSIWNTLINLSDLNGPALIINSKCQILNIVQGINTFSFKDPLFENNEFSLDSLMNTTNNTNTIIDTIDNTTIVGTNTIIGTIDNTTIVGTNTINNTNTTNNTSDISSTINNTNGIDSTIGINIDSNNINNIKDGNELNKLEPKIASQVWMFHSLGNNKFTIKSCYDKYFTSLNGITCSTDACSNNEIFQIQKYQNGFIIKDHMNNYLDFSTSLITTSTTITDSNLIYIKYQNIIKEKEITKSSVEMELEQLNKYHSFGKRELNQVKEIYDLKDAKNKGKINEILIERRAKFKGDKFCW